MKFLKQIFPVLMLIFMGVPQLSAENNPSFIKKEEWAKHAKLYNYYENTRLDNKSTAHHDEINKGKKPRRVEDGMSLAIFTKSSRLIYFIIAIIILTLIFVIVALVVSTFKKSGNSKQELLFRTSREKVFENIENADLETELQKAISDGRYKDAIRIKYLLALRTLNKHKLIVWKKEKTNGNYIRELLGKAEFEPFRKLTISFERLWYGDMDVTEKEYADTIPEFDKFQSLIGSREQ